MTGPFVIDIGFDKATYAAVVKGVGLAAALVGGFAGGMIARALPLSTSLWVGGILQTISNLAFAWLALIGPSVPALTVAIIFENFTGAIGTVIFVAYLSALCGVRAHTATQFALLTALAAVGRTTLSSGGGFVAESTGWFWFFVISALVAIPSFILLAWLQAQRAFPRTGQALRAGVLSFAPIRTRSELPMMFSSWIETVGSALDLIGVALIAIGLVIAFVRYATVATAPGGIDAYRRLRQDIGRAILLGLEVLVAADIIRTVAVTPTLDSVAILGAIVVIRTFLSISMQVEVEGRFPWQPERARDSASIRSPSAAASPPTGCPRRDNRARRRPARHARAASPPHRIVQEIGDVMHRGLAIDRGVEREDHLFHRRLMRARHQRIDGEVLRADAVERRQHATQHVIARVHRSRRVPAPIDRRHRPPPRSPKDRVCGSVQTVQGFWLSILPQTEQTVMRSRATSSASVSGPIRRSRFLIRCRAARRAERGPSPGSRASSWIRRSISGPATAFGM